MQPSIPPPHIVIIGAGIAGAGAACAFARRGIPVTVIESHEIASGGSGNPVAVIRPEPGGAHNPITTLTALGMQWLVQWFAQHKKEISHELCGAIRITRDAARHQKLAAHAVHHTDDWISEVSQEEATQLSASKVADHGFYLPVAGWVEPHSLVRSLLMHPLITVRTGLTVKQLVFTEDQFYQIGLSDGTVCTTERVILATAFAGTLISATLAIDSTRGQLSMLPEKAGRDLTKIICRDGYITPAVKGLHTVGATIQKGDDYTDARMRDDEENYQRLQRLLPDFCRDVNELRSGRVAFRAVTQDRLPAVGRLATGLYATLAHGSRGMTCAPWCGEWLASMVMEESTPLLDQWRDLLDPLRLAIQ